MEIADGTDFDTHRTAQPLPKAEAARPVPPPRTTRIPSAHTPIRTTQHPKSIVFPSGESVTFTDGASE